MSGCREVTSLPGCRGSAPANTLYLPCNQAAYRADEGFFIAAIA